MGGEGVETLVDVERIRRLSSEYCLAIAAGDADAVVAMFTDDGEFITDDTVARGRDGLREFYAAVASGAPRLPTVYNHVIDLDGDRAGCRSVADVRFDGEGVTTVRSGIYVDELRRVGGAWRFERRTFTSFPA